MNLFLKWKTEIFKIYIFNVEIIFTLFHIRKGATYYHSVLQIKAFSHVYNSISQTFRNWRPWDTAIPGLYFSQASVQSCRTELRTFSVVLQTLLHFILLVCLLIWPVNEPAALPLFLTSLGPMKKTLTQLYYVHKKNKK